MTSYYKTLKKIDENIQLTIKQALSQV